jgi:hypothetical protein
MHDEAKRSLDKARKLIAAADPDSLRYACLQLRSAIEELFYELIPLYKDELPTDIIHEWRPVQIIDALVDCDPLVEQDTRICMFDYDGDGNPAPPGYVGEQKAVSHKLLQKYYHALGSYLHAPLPGKQHDFAKLAKRLAATADVVAKRCAGEVLANLAAKATFTCDCGRHVTRNVRALEISPLVVCPDSKCRAQFEYIGTENGVSRFSLLVQTVTCPKCQAKIEVGLHKLDDGLVVVCEKCGGRIQLHRGYHAVPLDEAGQAAAQAAQ